MEETLVLSVGKLPNTLISSIGDRVWYNSRVLFSVVIGISSEVHSQKCNNRFPS